jgi:uncharacterized protein
MNEYIVPQFKQGQYSAGILSGVEALDKMARQLKLPSRPRSASSYILPLVLAGLVVFTIVSLIRRGSSGWAWLFWAGVFGVIGFVLYNMAQNSSSSSSGGFGGGFSGGGFSGGGGASGSW